MDSIWKEIYDLYPANQHLIWLNNCGTTPSSKVSIEAVGLYLQKYAEMGILTEQDKYPLLKQRIKKVLSELLNCDPSELALIHNTSEGMNLISHGVSLPNESEILILENEYPSNVYPWEHLEEKGHKIKFVKVGKTQEEFLDNFQKTISAKTALVSFSAAHWCTGMPFPLEDIGKICKEKGIIFSLDGAQGVGNFPIDVQKAQIDYMAFPAWKWLLGPLGLGVLFLSKRVWENTSLVFKGTGSVEGAENYLPYKKILKKDAERFEYSTANVNDWVYFRAILEYLEKIGFEKIQNRIYELVDFTANGLRDIGFTLKIDEFQKKTGILVAIPPKTDSGRIVAKLKEKGIIVADRMGGVRISPHVYNSMDQMETILEAIREIL